MLRWLILSIPLFLFSNELHSQGCCSGGSGSPIAGGYAQGVLQDRQVEVASNYQYIITDKFKAGDKDTSPLFDKFYSNYLYTRLAYGITKDLTMSVESGYFINKTQIGLDHADTIESSGIGDLLLFPRYDILNRTTATRRTEITLGMGLKIPLGKYNDSTVVYTNPSTGKKYYTTSPPIIQPTNGSNDFVFYSFFCRGYPLKNFKVFANMVYIRKGWNPIGQKFGDYASLALFTSKTFFDKFGVTLQVKGEFIAKMKYDKDVDMLALYNINVAATGGRKVFFLPQLSYSQNNLTIYALSEIPVYQYVYETQVASQHQLTVGVSYRFFSYKNKIKSIDGQTYYICPMNCEGSKSTTPSKCKVCGMDLIKQE